MTTTAVAAQSFGQVLRAEWLKLTTVRSTRWSLVALVAIGVGLTVLVCATSADRLASGESYDHPGSYVTWGMMVAQIAAVVLAALAVTTEYGTGMVRTTYAAVPRRGHVLLAKALVLGGVLGVAGVLTATLGYLGGNWFLDRAGIGLALTDDGVLRSLVGNGLYLAGLGVLTLGVGVLVRHTAAALTIVLGLVFVVGNMAFLLPGDWGTWVARLFPGNAGGAITTPVNFNPDLLDPWVGLGVFALEVLLVLVAARVVLARRDV